MVNMNEKPSATCRYFGKCQYKTGKCNNERTLKRNGEAHSLCEEHRIKQNLIQRRSDRKYQTVHAIRRRERSQRRAVLKKQVSLAVAQQLFFEHQQQKTLGIPLPQHHPLHLLSMNAKSDATAVSHGFGGPGVPSLLPPAPCPSSSTERATSSHSSTNAPVKGVSTAGKDLSTSNAVNNYTSCSILNFAVPSSHNTTALELMRSKFSGHFENIPTASCTGDKETWSDDDIEFLHTVLLT